MDRKNPEANPLLDSYGRYVARIDEALEAELGLHAGSAFAGPLRYALRGGKRIRPVILVLAARCAGGGEGDGNAYLAACAVEMLHTESVIHDDIIDNETRRREGEPFHVRYGYNASVLTCDYVLGLILSMCSRLDSPRITADLASTAVRMSEGELAEGRLEASGDVTFADYVRVVEDKTASAFEAAARIGGVIGGGSEAQVSALARFGASLGVAYQVRDDLTDWKNEDKLFNLLMRGGGDPREAFDRMERLLRDHAARASAALEALPGCPERDGLAGLVEFTKVRARGRWGRRSAPAVSAARGRRRSRP